MIGKIKSIFGKPEPSRNQILRDLIDNEIKPIYSGLMKSLYQYLMYFHSYNTSHEIKTSILTILFNKIDEFGKIKSLGQDYKEKFYDDYDVDNFESDKNMFNSKFSFYENCVKIQENNNFYLHSDVLVLLNSKGFYKKHFLRSDLAIESKRIMDGLDVVEVDSNASKFINYMIQSELCNVFEINHPFVKIFNHINGLTNEDFDDKTFETLVVFYFHMYRIVYLLSSTDYNAILHQILIHKNIEFARSFARLVPQINLLFSVVVDDLNSDEENAFWSVVLGLIDKSIEEFSEKFIVKGDGEAELAKNVLNKITSNLHEYISCKYEI